MYPTFGFGMVHSYMDLLGSDLITSVVQVNEASTVYKLLVLHYR